LDITQILGYFGALLVGLVLGLIGGGGSILSVPLFVYLLAVNPVTATAYSLFMVGVSSAFGAIQNIKKGLVDFKTATVFAIPAFIAVYITRITFNYPLILIEGFVVGILTGLVGAGGGFLIIPALVLLAKLPMKKAVATSLLIIAVKSLIGFIGDVENLDIDWTFLLSFTGVSVIGIFIGSYLSNFIDGKKLKKGFGYFVLIMGIYILFKELL
jgi:uncharacterized membrane protein YfcA